MKPRDSRNLTRVECVQAVVLVEEGWRENVSQLCWSGYKPTRAESGALNAYSFSPHPIPCNYPRKPDCACPSGFIKQRMADGITCVNSKKMSACINIADFMKYLREVRDYINGELYGILAIYKFLCFTTISFRQEKKRFRIVTLNVKTNQYTTNNVLAFKIENRIVGFLGRDENNKAIQNRIRTGGKITDNEWAAANSAVTSASFADTRKALHSTTVSAI
ncbi:hypothetical protein ILUMI_07198 [Ignelater luminosus]|uniref:Uncharacterized protein n=1 Tax=Ignelater luminosus TaxID=2038154 RepID=A0A8K0GEM0_IGNLU|nr:hypothetical protein ILUMI_07198 [Ignelater luminosus]